MPSGMNVWSLVKTQVAYKVTNKRLEPYLCKLRDSIQQVPKKGEMKERILSAVEFAICVLRTYSSFLSSFATSGFGRYGFISTPFIKVAK